MSVLVSVYLCPICYPLQSQHRYLIDFGGGFVYDKEIISCFFKRHHLHCKYNQFVEYFFIGKSALKTNKFGHVKCKMRPAYLRVRACARVSVCLCV